ncbi:hypothetical protein [Roseinatronobacter monicus]|uniref:Peptidase MA superfamily protein n=1 Tax=Roseinatronobacter monicus TaxID=393481 RepID=A0A543KEX6_9RHOB|nr:hypothetical protein [Roseinatronobacter monicus]TQM93633.1 hypothetical protein BD293_2276 [Roseinatronobacter monicus]
MTLRRLTALVFVLLSIALAWLLHSEPHVRAYLCPACSGFRQVAPQIYVDQQATDAQIDAALQDLAAAEGMVLDFYPERMSDPVWLLCLSGECGMRSLPRPLAMFYMNLFVFVYPDGATPTILAHELAHTELHERVGSNRRFFSQAVPTWFDEGLAVYISQDTRYLDVEDGVVTGCTAGDWPQPPSDQRTFRRLGATEAEAIYTASACQVIDWLGHHGGAEAVVSLLGEIRAGDSFRE